MKMIRRMKTRRRGAEDEDPPAPPQVTVQGAVVVQGPRTEIVAGIGLTLGKLPLRLTSGILYYI